MGGRLVRCRPRPTRPPSLPAVPAPRAPGRPLGPPPPPPAAVYGRRRGCGAPAGLAAEPSRRAAPPGSHGRRQRVEPGVNHLGSDYQPSGGSRLPPRAESAWMTRGLTRDCGARATIGLSPGPPSDVCRISADSQPKYVTRLWSCAAHARPVHPRFLPFQRRGRPADRSVRRHRRPQRSRPYGLSSLWGARCPVCCGGRHPRMRCAG